MAASLLALLRMRSSASWDMATNGAANDGAAFREKMKLEKVLGGLRQLMEERARKAFALRGVVPTPVDLEEEILRRDIAFLEEG